MTPTPDWLLDALEAMRPFLPPDFVGSFKVNVYRGSIGTVDLQATLKGDQIAPRRKATERR